MRCVRDHITTLPWARFTRRYRTMHCGMRKLSRETFSVLESHERVRALPLKGRALVRHSVSVVKRRRKRVLCALPRA